MSGSRPFVMSIAGFDPSAGAGILADIKCFEAHKVYGFGICSALTVQTDTEFLKNDWIETAQIIDQLNPLFKKFSIPAVKIGLIKDLDTLTEILEYLRSMNSGIKIVLDPILKASAGYKFHEWNTEPLKLISVLKQLNLISPNYDELLNLGADKEAAVICRNWAAYCPVLLKGGHALEAIGTDHLFDGEQQFSLTPGVDHVNQKHGSGCVLSAAITANLALGKNLLQSCTLAKRYIEQFLNSNTGLLGYHIS